MKKLFYLLLALPLVFAACEEPEQGTDKPVEKTPVLNVTETTLYFAVEGGAGVINYTVENAVEGTEVEATCEADWVANLTVAETITFTVAANDGEAREATIVVTYGELSKSVAIKQAAKGEEPKPNTPVFEAVTATVEYEWNVTMGEVEYKLENPIEGVEVKAKAGASWISQVQVKDGKIQFAMTENTGDAREGKITAEYGMLPAIEFTVKQGAYVAPDPVLTIDGETELEFAPEGGEGSFTYTLENPVEGVELEVKADVEWISNIVAADGTVSFTVAANEGNVRQGIITLTYGELKAEVAVKQYFPGYDPNMTYGVMALNYAKAQVGQNNTWDLIFFESVENLSDEVMTRITVQLPKANKMYIPNGSYSSEDGSILLQTSSEDTSHLSYFRYNSVAQVMQACELNVEVNTEACTAKFTGKITVAGAVYTFEWDGAVDGFIYEEIGEDGINEWKNWYMYSQWSSNKCSNVKANSAEGINFNLYVTNNVDPIAQGLGEGTYVVDVWNSTQDRFIEGGEYGGSKINGVQIELGGTMTVEHVGENYRITIDFVDINGNEYKGTYEGALPFTSYSDL